jgi:hypothetical protein
MPNTILQPATVKTFFHPLISWPAAAERRR